MTSAEPPAPPPPEEPPRPDPSRTMMLVLCYVWLLCLIPLLVEREDAEIQWNAKNGLVLSIAWIAVLIAYRILWVIFLPLGCVLSILFFVSCFVYAAVAVAAVVKAFRGERLVLPVLSPLVEKF
jgi:uncharacterized membrane protein